MKEAYALLRLKHEGVMKLINVFPIKNKLMVLFTEYLNGGELGQYIDKRKYPLSETDAK